jgi:hypothetical protein
MSVSRDDAGFMVDELVTALERLIKRAKEAGLSEKEAAVGLAIAAVKTGIEKLRDWEADEYAERMESMADAAADYGTDRDAEGW